MDRLTELFRDQQEFMDVLKEHRGLPAYPVDLTSKAGQQACREAALGGIEEWFEALKHLKNWKQHRATEVKELDRSEFVEEMCDALHYFIEVCVFAGVSPSELHDAYMKKGQVNKDRILNKGY